MYKPSFWIERLQNTVFQMPKQVGSLSISCLCGRGRKRELTIFVAKDRYTTQRHTHRTHRIPCRSQSNPFQLPTILFRETFTKGPFRGIDYFGPPRRGPVPSFCDAVSHKDNIQVVRSLLGVIDHCVVMCHPVLYGFFRLRFFWIGACASLVSVSVDIL